MAYIDFTSGSTASYSLYTVAANATGSKLSHLEEAAANIGAQDPLSSIRHETLLGRWIKELFAIGHTSALADPKLEAIRRLAVTARLGGESQLAEEMRAAVASGTGVMQAMMIIARFGRSVPA